MNAAPRLARNGPRRAEEGLARVEDLLRPPLTDAEPSVLRRPVVGLRLTGQTTDASLVSGCAGRRRRYERFYAILVLTSILTSLAAGWYRRRSPRVRGSRSTTSRMPARAWTSSKETRL